MIIQAKNDNLKEIYNYIDNEYYKCIYLYLDLKKYGLNNPNIKVWILKGNNNITAIVLQYYSGMHIYSKKCNFDVEEFVKLVQNNNPTMICGEKCVIEKTKNSLKNYYIENGWVRGLEKIENSISCECVEKAKYDDFSQIANLLYYDEIGSSYTLEDLTSQLYERNKEGFVRNYVIKEGDRVISHAGTGAENEKIAMLAYVITDSNYRGKGYAKKVCSYVCNDLIKEGKKVFLINYSKESTFLYDKLGFKIYCDWSKLYLNLKENKN